MKPTLAALLALPLIAACGDDVDAAYESAKETAQKIADEVSQLSMEEVREQGESLMIAMREGLETVKTSEDVQKLREKMEPTVDRLIALKDRLGAKLPGTEELRAAVDRMKEQFEEGSELREAIDPFLEKLKQLFS